MHRLSPSAWLGLILLSWGCGSVDEPGDAEEYYDLVGELGSATIEVVD